MAPGASKHTSGEAERLRRRYRQKAPPTAAYLVREEVLATAYARECSDDLLEWLGAGVKRCRVHWTRATTVSARVPAWVLISKI